MNAMSDLVVAVDGGGSKTDAVAVGLDGTVIARFRAGASTAFPDTMAASAAVVDEVITGVLRKVGEHRLIQTNVYLSGLDTDEEIEAFRREVGDRTWSVGAEGSPVVVDNDMFALLRAGTLDPDAIAVVCGTGINCVGVRADGKHARFLAWGAISGDWGGGASLGEMALWHAARAWDGRGADTVLVKSVPAHFGMPGMREVIDRFHLGEFAMARLAELVPVLFAASNAGDHAARTVLDRQGQEIVDMASNAAERLELTDKPVPVVLGGGVLSAGDRHLLGGIEEGLRARLPLATSTVVRERPILGAGLAALETVGVGSAVLDRARRTLHDVSRD